MVTAPYIISSYSSIANYIDDVVNVVYQILSFMHGDDGPRTSPTIHPAANPVSFIMDSHIQTDTSPACFFMMLAGAGCLPHNLPLQQMETPSTVILLDNLPKAKQSKGMWGQLVNVEKRELQRSRWALGCAIASQLCLYVQTSFAVSF